MLECLKLLFSHTITRAWVEGGERALHANVTYCTDGPLQFLTHLPGQPSSLVSNLPKFVCAKEMH